jgi:SIR2-like protein
MFPDHIHIAQIRSALWTGREYGRAAVLVGSGFSRNASPAKTAPRPFPLWNDLTRLLIDQLYPPGSQQDYEREVAGRQGESTSGALRLAQEFEAAHGRQRLDQLLLDAIPDQDWLPGRLHHLLLKLLWADVFTTNYETLLERASLSLSDRSYALIQTVAEIPFAIRPRLVKVHGSFPSTRPFIITEEDYRTYPRQFAPFINLVQQSMMENVFCLVGFSGDDPNFLHWSGWVRDSLGKSAPRIYLCGVLGLNDAKRRMLHERNVTPIDMAPLFPLDKFPDRAVRHQLGTEWFLLNLEAGDQPDPLSWPRYQPKPKTPPSPGLPELLPTDARQLERERFFPEEQ